MGTKDCGRWALYGSSEVAGVSATGGPVAGVLVAGGGKIQLYKLGNIREKEMRVRFTAEKY